MRPSDRLRTDAGFTLLEAIVAMLILVVILGIIAVFLSFGFRMMNQQRILSNADTLGSTVQSTLEDALRYATSCKVSADGSSVTFTTKQDSAYRSAGTYTISNHGDGTLWIADSSGSKSGPLLPSYTYVDSDTVSCAFSYSNDQAHITTTVTSTAGVRSTDSYVTLLNGA